MNSDLSSPSYMTLARGDVLARACGSALISLGHHESLHELRHVCFLKLAYKGDAGAIVEVLAAICSTSTYRPTESMM